MTDLLKRLRGRGVDVRYQPTSLGQLSDAIFDEAADEIERLRAALADVMRHPDSTILADIIDRKPGLESLRALLRECLKESIKILPQDGGE